MSDGKGKPPSDKDVTIKKSFVAKHAHDEFEIDIDLETDFTELASRPTADLFSDEEEVTNEISQEDLAKVVGENSEVDTIFPISSDDKVLPVFLPTRADTPSKPMITGIEQDSSLPDLSENDQKTLPPSPESYFSEPEELFDDVSGLRDSPPIHDLSNPDPDPVDVLDLPPQKEDTPSRSLKFSKGFSAGMNPLDVSNFSNPNKSSTSHGGSMPIIIRQGPAPMARSKRVVRRWYQPSVRDILLFLLVVVLGLGIWVSWSIYQDYKKTIGWEKFNKGRASIEKARMEAIESKQPKVQRDIP